MMTGQKGSDEGQASLAVVIRSAWARSRAELVGQGIHAPLQSQEVPAGDGRGCAPAVQAAACRAD